MQEKEKKERGENEKSKTIGEKNPKLENLSHWAEIGHQIINRNNFKSYVEVQTSNIFIK